MKSKIEQKIKNAREATDEMFAALEELNESLKEKEPEKWLPRRGGYYRVNIDGVVWLCIAASIEKVRVTDFVSLRHESTYLGYNMGTLIRENFYPCTPSEIALLDSKLAEQGKRFDKEKLELVDIPKFKVGDWFIPHKPKENKTHIFWVEEMDKFDGVALQVSEPKFKNAEGIYSEVADWHFHPDWCEKTTAPKHKEPIIGEMMICWDKEIRDATCRLFSHPRGKQYHDHKGIDWNNAILFESPEQYKTFLKS